MRILITGSTASQSNPASHRKSVNFAGLLWEVLRAEPTNEVYWLEPSVTWDDAYLGRFDHVFVGVAPALGMGANRIYGAVSVIERLWGDRRLTLFVDQPDPDLITRSLKSILANWDSFTKPFFSYRKEYDLARESRTNARLRMAMMRLATRPWPPTIAPGFPWSDNNRISMFLPDGARGRLQTVNLDYLLLSQFEAEQHEMGITRLASWSYEKSADWRWIQAQNLGLPVNQLPANHRMPMDNAVLQQLRESTGFLAGPTRGHVWWTPKVAMALSQQTPVFTDWQRSQVLGSEWARLPGTFEMFRLQSAERLATNQRASFVAAIPGPEDIIKKLYKAAGVGPANRSRSIA